MICDDDNDDAPRRLIAMVTASEPQPGSIRTLGDFAAWRAAEDRRMFAELQEQITAHFEREDGDQVLH